MMPNVEIQRTFQDLESINPSASLDVWILVGNSMKLKDPVIFQKRPTSKLPCPDDLSDLSFSKDLVSSSQDLTTDGIQITVVSHDAVWYAMGWPGYSATAVPFQQKGRLGSAAWRDTVPLRSTAEVAWNGRWIGEGWSWKNYPPSTIYACISCSQHPCGGQPKPTRNTSAMESKPSSQDH